MEDFERLNIASGSAFEPLRGYSRAVRMGNSLYISGTTAMTGNGDVVGSGSSYEQTKYVIKVIKDVLSAAGFSLNDVVRTRLFVTNMLEWNEYARAHRETFDAIRPASSIVQVSRLVDPRLLVEMEVDAQKGASSVQSMKL